MSKQIITQHGFIKGEISPRLYARFDTDEYTKGLKKAINAVVYPQGPVRRRNGSKFVAEVADSSDMVKLVKYEPSSSIRFLLEFGDSYIRFYSDQGQVLEADLTITGVTQANPAVVTSTAHGLSNGDQVYISGVAGMTELNGLRFTIANVAANTFELSGIDSSAYTAYTSGGVANRIYEIVSPYSAAEVQDIQYKRIADTLHIVHPSHEPRTLVRSSDANWTLAVQSFSPPVTYESGYEPAATVTPAATTGIDVNFTAGSGVFLEGDIGRQIINNSTGETGRASITAITSSTVAVCDIIEDFTDTNAIASGDWKIDLSPLVQLEVNNIQAGAISNIRSEYIDGTLAKDKFTITGVTQASPGVVTTSANHGYSAGDKILIKDIVGMTQINNRVLTVGTTTATTFELHGENTTGYSGYSSAGNVREVLTDKAVDAFRSADVGKYIVGNGGVMQIISVNSADDVDAEVLKSLNTDDDVTQWSLETDAWTAERGYPSSVGIFQQRLIYASTTAQPNNVWFSEIGIYNGFGIGPDDDDSIEIELDDGPVSWISASNDLILGTLTSEAVISSRTNNLSVTASNMNQKITTYYGSSSQQVDNVREEVLFIQSSGRKIRTYRYDFNIDGYRGDNITFLVDHLTEDGIKELVYVQEPDSIVYAVTDGGDILAGTYDRNKQIIAWTLFETDGEYEQIQSIRNNTENEVWVVVKRKVNGSYKRYIELFVNGDGADDLHSFSDSFLTLSNNLAITNITAANPAVVTSASHGLSNGDIVIIKDLVDPSSSELDSTKTNMTALNNCTFTVANAATNTFELSGVDTSDYNAYESGGNVWNKVTSISGLDHLEGKSVQIKTDGAAHPNKTVSSGSITLERASGEIVIGLPYTTTIQTLSHEFQTGRGSPQGQRQRWINPLLIVHKSYPPMLNGEFLPSRSASDSMDKKVPLFSGILEYGNLKMSNNSEITITSGDAFPFQLSGITGTLEFNIK